MKSHRKQKRIKDKEKTLKQEAKLSKVMEDNSVILERMKNVSSSCDKLLQCLGVDSKEEIDESSMHKKLMRMLKRELLELAESIGCKVQPSMTKSAIIEAIQAEQEI
jgi:hypothetical protein